MKRVIAQILTLALTAGILALPAAAEDARIAGVPFANPKSGHPDNVISLGFRLVFIARGTDKLENPSGILTTFGLLNDGLTQKFEPTRTEPDENLYLVFDHNL